MAPRPQLSVRRLGALVATGLILGAALLLLNRSIIEHDIPRLTQLGNGRLSDVRCLRVRPTRTVALTSGGLRLVGDLYLPETPAGSPAIVLTHGATSHGRDLPLYRVLAERLRATGYTVLALDLRGFHDSQKPHDLTDPSAFDFAADYSAALDSLPRWAPIDTTRIYAMAHSFSAGAALAASTHDARLQRLVLIGPARRLTHRFLQPNAPDSAYFVNRWQRDMELPQPVSYAVWTQVLEPINVENYASGGHYRASTPVLLVDAERESPLDLAFLRGLASTMPQPVDYWTVPATDHYLNVSRFLTATYPWIPERLASMPCYDRKVVDDFVAHVDAWLHEPRSRPGPDSPPTLVPAGTGMAPQ